MAGSQSPVRPSSSNSVARLAAAVKPFLYRWEHSCVSSFGAVQVLGVGVAHRLE
ncbi:TPA: hypothetical protein ACH3X3_007485 [Trebouxia sp. C0006]